QCLSGGYAFSLSGGCKLPIKCPKGCLQPQSQFNVQRVVDRELMTSSQLNDSATVRCLIKIHGNRIED
ncbi:MAG: hypothetical protein OXH76_22020, partial [Boseongicola sp.]|nr:hypothetical protein [Boseongicola sp.]